MTGIVNFLLIPFCCNRNHYFVVRIWGQEHRFCTRSVPILFGALSMISYIIIGGFEDVNGSIMALTGILLTFPDLIYWAVTRLNLVPDHIEIRVLNGFLLGIGIIIFGQASIVLVIKIAVPVVIFTTMIIANWKLKPISKNSLRLDELNN